MKRVNNGVENNCIFSTSDISDVLLLSKVRKLLKSASNVRTFEADSVSEPIREQYLYIWGRFCTFEADSIHLRPILYIWGRDNLFCHVICLSQSDSCTFEAESVWANQTESASNVWISLKCTYRFRTFEANWTLPGEGVRSLGQSCWFHGQSHSHARESCTFEADSYIWGRSVHLRPIPILAKLIDR